MRSIRGVSPFAIALSALALVIAARATPTRAAGVRGCLSIAQAARALESPRAEEGSGEIGNPSTCTFFPVYPPLARPKKLARLTIAIYKPGLPGWEELAKSACELDNEACPYSRVVTKERDPLRYMRLIYGALVKSGATVGQLDNLPGNRDPGFFWNAEHPVGQTFAVMYVQEQKRFVSLGCSHGPENLYPNGWFETCAVTAARLVYINMTT